MDPLRSSGERRSDPLPSDIAEPLCRAGHRLGPFGRHVLWYPTVSSTNETLGELADRGAEEGCVVVADAQSAGRGRHGRAWHSPPGVGLYVSVLLRPASSVASLVTIAAGVALADGIRRSTGAVPQLKWPNDLYLGGRKFAGILAEAGASTTAGTMHVVLGFGINVLPAPFPRELAPRVTSLEGELGRQVDRGALLVECLAGLAGVYADLEQGRSGQVLARWRTHAGATLNRPVEWDGGAVPRRGTASDIDESGALLVRTETGVVRLISGELRWR